MARTKYTKKAVKATKKAYPKKAYSATRKPYIAKVVKRTMKSMAEVKQTRILYTKSDNTGLSPYNSSNWSLDNGLFALSPVQNRIEIPQGDGEGNRIGNRVTTKSSYLTGCFYPTAYDTVFNPTPRPQDVMVIIYKIIGGGSTITSTLSTLFQNGNTASGPTSSLIDTTLPINTDKYKIFYKKIFKIGSADNTGSGSATANQFYANNDYKRNQRFYIPLTKFMDKVYKYDNSNLSANNNMLYMAVLPMNCDGSQPAAGNLLRTVSMIMTQVYKYTDA